MKARDPLARWPRGAACAIVVRFIQRYQVVLCFGQGSCDVRFENALVSALSRLLFGILSCRPVSRSPLDCTSPVGLNHSQPLPRLPPSSRHTGPPMRPRRAGDSTFPVSRTASIRVWKPHGSGRESSTPATAPSPPVPLSAGCANLKRPLPPVRNMSVQGFCEGVFSTASIQYGIDRREGSPPMTGRFFSSCLFPLAFFLPGFSCSRHEPVCPARARLRSR